MSGRCRHNNKSRIIKPFEHALYGSGEPHYNAQAHGGITVYEKCLTCGAYRNINSNMFFEEVGRWHSGRSAEVYNK